MSGDQESTFFIERLSNIAGFLGADIESRIAAALEPGRFEALMAGEKPTQADLVTLAQICDLPLSTMFVLDQPADAIFELFVSEIRYVARRLPEDVKAEAASALLDISYAMRDYMTRQHQRVAEERPALRLVKSDMREIPTDDASVTAKSASNDA